MKINSREDLLQIFSPPPKRGIKKNLRLAEMLGFGREDRLLLVNADDFGICHGTNSAINDLKQKGLIDSISLLAGARDFDQAIDLARKSNSPVGIHLSLTSEWKDKVIEPVESSYKIPSLLDSKGNLHSDIRDLYQNINLVEIELECRAQIRKIQNAGIEIDHLDTHMGALQLNSQLLGLYMEMADELKLPVRLGSEALALLMGLPKYMLRTALDMNLIFPDNLVYIPMSLTPVKEERLDIYKYMLENLPEGVTEFYFHPTLNTDDYKGLVHQYNDRETVDYNQVRLWDYDFLISDDFTKILENNNIKRVNYSDLKSLID